MGNFILRTVISVRLSFAALGAKQDAARRTQIATSFAQSRLHVFGENPKKSRDLVCTGQQAGKTLNHFVSKAGCIQQPASKSASSQQASQPGAIEPAEAIWHPGAIGNHFGIELY
mgnify:CR=1 FL=1